MTRLGDIDALDRAMYHKSFEVDDGRNVWNSGLWIRYKIYEEASREAPTVNPWEVVYEGLAQIPLFCGTYDAKNGSKEFMHGVSTVMESIAMKAGKQEEFDEMFLKNILKSKREEE